MIPRFTQAQRAAIQELIELPAGSLRTAKDRLAISDVRRALDLPPIPYGRFLGPDCWLAGGGVLRWLCRDCTKKDETDGDFDFFFPGLDALDRTARAMLAEGFKLRGYKSPARNIRDYIRRPVKDIAGTGICDEAGNLTPITPEFVRRLRLRCLDLRSPEGDSMQLVTFVQPTTVATILRFDFSICQFGLDDRHLSFGPWAWHDILQSRLRKQVLDRPDSSFRRMIKYAQRGFRPYPGTVAQISASAVACFAVRFGRFLLISLERPPAETPVHDARVAPGLVTENRPRFSP